MSNEYLKVEDVMTAFLESTGLTHEKFAEALNEKLVNIDIDRVSVTNWKNGKSAPHTDFLLVCAVVYRNWIRTWAIACLKVKLPEVFDSGMVSFNTRKAE